MTCIVNKVVFNQLLLPPVLQVPAGKKVRIRFTMFRMKEPGVDTRVCHKDYVEVMGTK